MMRATSIVLALLFVLTACLAAAEIPSTISYQGVLRDDSGTPVADGDYDMTFSLYDVGTGGTPVWQEEQTVTVAGGIFSVRLGAVAPLDADPDLTFEDAYCLGIEIGDAGELSPRRWLTTSPYAFRAAVAESLVGGGGVTVPGSDTQMLYNDGGSLGAANVYYSDATGHVGIGVQPSSYNTLDLGGGGLNCGLGTFGAGVLTNSLGEEAGSNLYVSHQTTRFTGRVGIGDNPATGVNLDVAGLTETNQFRLPTSPSDGYVLTSDASGNGTWQPAATGIGGTGTNDYVAKFTGSTTLGNSPIRLSGNYVGINTSPAAMLHVNGTLKVEEEAFFYGDLFSSNLIGDGDLALFAGGPRRLHISGTTGAVGIGTATPGAKLTVSSSSYDDHILIERPGDQSGHITIGGSHLIMNVGTGSPLAIGADGDVGIGTTSPAAKLDVDGTTAMTGFRMPTGAAAGNILTADVSGNGTWQPAPGVTVPGSDTQLLYNDGGGLGAAGLYYNDTNGRLGVGVSSPTRALDLGPSGGILCGNVLAEGGLTTNSISPSGSGMVSVSAAQFYVGGSMGVGTPPVVGIDLEVDGLTRTDEIRITTSPSDGYVLTSDSSGNGTWQAVPTELTTDSVGSDEIATDAVGSEEIATGAVGSSEIATGAVDSDEIATNAVGSDEIATDAVGADEIAYEAVGVTELANTFKAKYFNVNTSIGGEYIWYPPDWSKGTPLIVTVGSSGRLNIQDTASSGTVNIVITGNGSYITTTTAPLTYNMTTVGAVYDYYIYPVDPAKTWYVHVNGALVSGGRFVGVVQAAAN